MTELHNLPGGFQKRPEGQGPLFKAETRKVGANNPSVNFRGRQGGGRRNMGQTVEHAENIKGTLIRMLKYFQAEELVKLSRGTIEIIDYEELELMQE